MSEGLLEDLRWVPEPGRSGVFRLQMSNDWSFLYPSGGVLMSAALAAMKEVLDTPEQRLVSATATFCEPLKAGPLVIEVSVLRRGRAAAQVQAQVWQGTDVPTDQNAGLHCIGTYAISREGPEVTGATPPDVPHWRACGPWPKRERPYTFFDRFDDRVARGHTWADKDWSAGAARSARWLKYSRPVRAADGSLDPIAIPPIVDLMPGALLQALGPQTPRFFAPSLDLTVHILEPSPRDWMLCSAFGRRARAGIASCDMEVWDEDGRLVAYATQTMMIRRQRSAA